MSFYLTQVLNRAPLLPKIVISHQKVFPNIIKTTFLIRGNIFCTAFAREAAPDIGQANINENKFQRNFFVNKFKQYIKNNSKYEYLLFKSKLNSIISTSHSGTLNLLNTFFETGKYSDNLAKLSEVFKEESKELTNDEFLEVVYFIIKFRDSDVMNMNELTNNVFDELQKRYSSFSTLEKFKILYLHYDYKCFSKIYFKGIEKFCKKIHQLNLQEVTLLLLLRSFRSLYKVDYRLSVEQHLCSIFEHLTMEELEIVLYGFQKAYFTFYDENSVKKIFSKYLTSIDNVDESSINLLCTALKVSAMSKHFNCIKEFQKEMIQHASKLSLNNLINLLYVTVRWNYLDLALFQYTVKKFKENMDNISVSDICRLSYLLVRLNINEEEFLKLAIQKYESNLDLLQSSADLVIFVSHLVHFKYYVDSLIKSAMKEEFFQNFSKGSLLFKESMVFLYYCLKIEKPEYQFSVFNEYSEKKMRGVSYYMSLSPLHKFKANSKILKVHLKIRWLESKITNQLSELYGEDNILWKKVLPHCQNMLILRFDSDLNFKKIPEEYLLQKGKIVKPLDDDHFWVCFLFFNQKGLTHDTLTLFDQRNIDNLKALGYEPIWFFLENITENENFCLGDEIKKKLKELVEQKN